MKPTGRIFGCLVCGLPTGALHEVFFGTGFREISILYNLQVPLCGRHHEVAHGRRPPEGERMIPYERMNQEECIDFFCEFLGVEKDRARRELNYAGDRPYLDMTSPLCRQKIFKKCV